MTSSNDSAQRLRQQPHGLNPQLSTRVHDHERSPAPAVAHTLAVDAEMELLLLPARRPSSAAQPADAPGRPPSGFDDAFAEAAAKRVQLRWCAFNGTDPCALQTQECYDSVREQLVLRLKSNIGLKRFLRSRYYTLSVILGTVALSYGSVPLYKMICQTTGWGGQPVRAHGPDVDYSEDGLAARLVPVTTAPRIRVTFNSSVSDILPWKFTPQQREVRVLPGETALAFYTATNNSDQDIIGVATYSVTPGQVAPYFSKIQCFCFEEQRLNAGETVDMPVFFYLDPDIVNDVNMRGIETVTLNYTFFKAKYDDNGKFKAPTPFASN
ncbi:cytochrome c oxidase assembly protein CtaG/Cox11 [Colletotrichum scovillei]|nr:cytochrome c oxidase assembly protein CtaG/Cox11 [Colletotrichum scovillei]